MCGRYTIINEKEVQMYYDKPLIGGIALTPRYNVSPGQFVPIVTTTGIESMKWGLIPSWAKDPSVGYKMINARSESLLERPSYRGLIKANRCIVPASGFYEWEKIGKDKIPHYFYMKDKSRISLAGLWTEWKDIEGYPIRSFTIITTEPNEMVAAIHNRMPVILDRDEVNAWLDPSITDPAEVMPMLDSYPANQMTSIKVSTKINAGKVDAPELIQPQ